MEMLLKVLCMGPFGEEYEASGGAENILKYTGREFDRETDLYYYRKRIYDWETGQFKSEDPIGFEGGINHYVYVDNNPINVVDPFGLESVLILKTEKHETDPIAPWRRAGNYAVIDSINKYADKFNELNIIVENVNKVSQVNNLLKNNQDIVNIKLIGHSSPKAIYVGAESLPDTNISFLDGSSNIDPNNLNWDNLTQDAVIDIWGCRAGAGNNSVAQNIANASGATVKAPNTYLNFNEETGEPFMRWWRFGEWKTFQPQANGGFVLYPNKPNLNMMQNVYSK
jgi:RHS repeat-associated protein